MLDLTSKLLENRIIMLRGHIDDELAESVIAQLLYLEHKNPDKDISIYINSRGGSIIDGLAIYDTMNFIKCDVETVCVGQAGSMASFILAGGRKGKRYALPNSSILVHQPSGGAVGKTNDVIREAEQLQEVKNKMVALLSKNTSQSIDVVEKAISFDNMMTADEALDFGLIDKILQ